MLLAKVAEDLSRSGSLSQHPAVAPPGSVHPGPYTQSGPANQVTWASHVWYLEGWTRSQPCSAKGPPSAEAAVGTSGLVCEHQPVHGGGPDLLLTSFAGAVPMAGHGCGLALCYGEG